MYELLYIIRAKIQEKELESVIGRVSSLIKENKGKIICQKNLGSKTLAYPIKHTLLGYYILNKFNLEAQKVKKVNENLKLMPEILRHQIIKIKPKKEKTSRVLEKKVEERRPKISLKELDQKLKELLEGEKI